MRRRNTAGGKAAKTQRRKTLKRRNAPETTPGHKSSPTDANEKIALLERRLNEALEQQAATSDVLKVISKSRGQLEPVFNAILENAVQICGAKFGQLFLFEDDGFRTSAMHDVPRAFAEKRRREPFFRPSAGSPLGRVMQTRQVAHIVDVTAEQGYAGDQAVIDLAKLGGARTTVAVPLLNGNELVGAISIYHKEIRPFTDKQIELLTNFAAQAVIAIENTRLLNELRQRTDDLSESLEQQTATSEVLHVISSSPGELEPVFDAMLQNAVRICGATFGLLWLREGAANAFRSVATHGAPRAYVDFVRSQVFRPEPKTDLGTLVRTKEVFQFADLAAAPTYGDNLRKATVDLAGARTLIAVPMLKDNEVIGVITIYRQEVRRFTDKQIELVKNFAAQAVIAIENARLLNELRDSLDQQTATSQVLGVISSSPTDVQPVFDAIASSSVNLCGAGYCIVYSFDGKMISVVAHHNLDRVALDALRQLWPMAPDARALIGRTILDRQVLHVSDVAAEPNYTFANTSQAPLGIRTFLGVPMLREGRPIGAIGLYRRNVKLFSDRQIDLVKSFADQAVIAIENVRLFERVEARTRELAKSLEELRTTQDRLVQTQKLALLGQLTAGIAHEIKNPLNFVNNFSGISAELIDELQGALKGMPLDDKARAEINELTGTLKSNFDKVVHHGRRADAIVKNMLQHSREGAGEHRVIDINALVEESLNLAWHGARAETQGFEIKVNQSFDPVAGEADIFPQDIRRALLNMISNGFYAATKRRAESNGGDYEPSLTASTKSLGDCVEIRIRDNGTGMTPDVKEQMFNPFFTTKPTGEGTGLGLSISHDIIVKQHGGSIEVDTQPGEFTEIRVILPRVAVFV